MRRRCLVLMINESDHTNQIKTSEIIKQAQPVFGFRISSVDQPKEVNEENKTMMMMVKRRRRRRKYIKSQLGPVCDDTQHNTTHAHSHKNNFVIYGEEEEGEDP
jgi:hypothetical protein